MSPHDDIGSSPNRARRSRLFRGRPDALMVDEWVPNITLPPLPDTPLEEDDPELVAVDEHGLPTFEDEPDIEEEAYAGPARLFVGPGRRGTPIRSPDDDEEDGAYVFIDPEDYFVAELRLPRPEDGLPFRVGSVDRADGEEDDDGEEPLDTDEASHPHLASSDLEAPFSVSLEQPDPEHLGSFGDEEDEDELEDLDEESGSFTGVEDVSADLDELIGGGVPPMAHDRAEAPTPGSAPRGVRAVVDIPTSPHERPRGAAPSRRSGADRLSELPPLPHRGSSVAGPALRGPRPFVDPREPAPSRWSGVVVLLVVVVVAVGAGLVWYLLRA